MTMTDNQSTRREFLKTLGLSAGATLAGSGVLAGIIDNEQIQRLNPEQQEFMIRYGKWMDDFIEVIRIQKKDPGNLENHNRMMALTDTADQWRPQLNEYMKDEKFSLIYQASIERMKKEI